MATHPTQYAHPEALVETDWIVKHPKDGVLLSDTGHIPGMVCIDWCADLQA